jgi:carboxyl-terminal processing protease
VGMEVVPVGDSMFVGEVFPGSPSQGAGFRRGDRLLTVDGVAINGMPLDSVVGRLRGLPSSAVAVEIERGGRSNGPATLRRAAVRVPAVPYMVVQRGIAYVPLPGVSGSAGPDVEAALARAARSGAKGVVLDLRGNGGGAVDQAVHVVSTMLPPQQSVLEIRERANSLLLRTEPTATRVDLPVIVLQDGGTASAAEIIGGALQDHDRALIVGTRSYGKGLAQSVFPLEGGWALKLTTARWFTPAGRSIHRDRTAADSARHAEEIAATAGVNAPPARTFKTDAGRSLAGDGGIAPDVVVTYDTLTGPERATALQLGRDGASVNRALARVAHHLSLQVDTTFTVTPAWRETLRRALVQEKVAVDSAQWEAASPYVSQLLEQRVATFAFGPGEARRRALARDRHYQVADSLLRAATSARDLVFRVGAGTGAAARREGGV